MRLWNPCQNERDIRHRKGALLDGIVERDPTTPPAELHTPRAIQRPTSHAPTTQATTHRHTDTLTTVYLYIRWRWVGGWGVNFCFDVRELTWRWSWMPMLPSKPETITLHKVMFHIKRKTRASLANHIPASKGRSREEAALYIYINISLYK